MKFADVNVLIYAVNASAPQHDAAHRALAQAYAQGPVGFAWVAVLGFLRLTTRTGILPQPLPVEGALDIVHRWLDHPAAVILHPTARHAAVLGRLLIGAGQGGGLVSDAHFAALAIEHDAELLTFDGDFARFAGLRWSKPV